MDIRAGVKEKKTALQKRKKGRQTPKQSDHPSPETKTKIKNGQSMNNARKAGQEGLKQQTNSDRNKEKKQKKRCERGKKITREAGTQRKLI